MLDMMDLVMQSKFLGWDFQLDYVVMIDGGWYVNRSGLGGDVG